MIRNVPNKNRELDIILVTLGGSAETVAYLVKQIRERFNHVAFILPYMAMSAGTIFCMSGDEIIMDESAFFDPIDPQVTWQKWQMVASSITRNLTQGYSRQRNSANKKWIST